MRRFINRQEAGRELAAMLHAFADRTDVTVLGLPRGGVPVAFEVAAALHAPLDVLTVRKIGHPDNEEYALGAIATGGVTAIDWTLAGATSVDDRALATVIARERAELECREALYRGERGPLRVHNRTVIVVDDGLATGATMRAAVAALRTLEPARIVVATPVASREAETLLRPAADAFVSAYLPADLLSVGQWYDDFSQITDVEVLHLLQRATGLSRAPRRDAAAAGAWYA
jgi:putative phosphoribosyl transferase